MDQKQALDLIQQGYTPAYIEGLKIEQVRTGKTVNQVSPDTQATEALANRWGITLAGAKSTIAEGLA